MGRGVSSVPRGESQRDKTQQPRGWKGRRSRRSVGPRDVAERVHAVGVDGEFDLDKSSMSNGRDVAIVASRDELRVIEFGVVSGEPGDESLPYGRGKRHVDFRFADVLAGKWRDERRAVASDDVAAEEVEAVDADAESGPAEGVRALERDVYRKVPHDASIRPWDSTRHLRQARLDAVDHCPVGAEGEAVPNVEVVVRKLRTPVPKTVVRLPLTSPDSICPCTVT
mmetsp:Transcript_13625/g.43028  ORF Transcript_13625/g.43028 Transcript_13625/m.43028 type:complete len:225 (-) Transcript_13625:114-788(-)